LRFVCLAHCAVFELTGLARGGQQIQGSRECWTKATKLLIQLASLQVRADVVA
jgi:hypothetical protein